MALWCLTDISTSLKCCSNSCASGILPRQSGSPSSDLTDLRVVFEAERIGSREVEKGKQIGICTDLTRVHSVKCH